VFAVLTIQSNAGTDTTATRRPVESPPSQPAHVNLSRGYGNLPLAFEPNRGQTDARVRFLARGGGMMAFFTDTETVMVLSRAERRDPKASPLERRAPAEVERTVVRMKLENASRPRRAIGLEKLPGISNYFIGNDPSKWRTNVPQYARIQYEGVYPGIDQVWYGNQRRLEYDFVVAPGADPKQIRVAYEGVESLKVEADGDLVLRTALGEVRQQKPRVYQEIGGKQVEVAAQYAIVARHRVSFELARYDRKRELRIDPVVLVYSTYLGGSGGDYSKGIAVDAAGSAYVTGWTTSTNFPTQSPYQATLKGSQNAFVTKLTPAGNALVYSTYLGGSGNDAASGIAVDAAGSAYVTGWTTSTNFPTQSPFQATNKGVRQQGTAFVTKLTPAGNALVYSTYLGGSGTNGDGGTGIAVDAAGSAYITGSTTSTNFPTQSPYQGTYGGGDFDAFVTKLTPTGNALTYSTYLGGSGQDQGSGIAVDGAGSAYVTGYTDSSNFPTQSPYQATKQGVVNAFVTKLTPTGNALAYSTYLGGSAEDYGYAIAVDAAGSAYVTGETGSSNFPTQSPYQATFQGGIDDAFVTKLTPAGNALAYSTYLGGSYFDQGYAIAVDGAGSAYVTGSTQSTNFPTQSPYQAAFQGGDRAAFVTKLMPAGNALAYSTYLGGSYSDEGYGIAMDASGSANVTGWTASTNFPTQSPYQATLQGGVDAFVTKLSSCPTVPATGAIQWTTLWCDEFDGPTAASPDTTKWNFDVGNGCAYGICGWGNNELETYCGPPGYQGNPAACPSSFSTSTSNAYVDGNGHLAIKVREQSSVWTSARLKTQGFSGFTYGRFEASIQIPSHTGLWPAFWMLGNNGTWPASGESDIMENWPALGPSVNKSTIHTAVSGGSGIGMVHNFPSGQQVNTAFHTYGVIWSPYMVQYYIDDPTNPFFVVTASDLQPGDTWPFNGPNSFYILLNMAVGGTLGGSPDSGTVTADPMLVDYVRQYQAAPIGAPGMPTPAPILVASGSGSTSVTLNSTSGSGRVYLTCATTAPASSCSITTSDPRNSHTLDFTSASTGTASVSITTTGNTPTGNYIAIVSAYTVSNTSGSPDATWSVPVLVHPPFFTGEVYLANGVYSLAFPGTGYLFGDYAYLGSGWIYHFDMGYDYVCPGNGSEVYLWDLTSGHWWYTNSGDFPFLYDFSLNAWLYYVPDAKNPGHYTTSPRYFVNMTTRQTFTM
jgi:beta-glucanase (GH16 family)